MPEGKRYFVNNGERHAIPASQAADYLKDFPQAQEMALLNTGDGQKSAIPLTDLPNFLTDFPGAKPFEVQDAPYYMNYITEGAKKAANPVSNIPIIPGSQTPPKAEMNNDVVMPGGVGYDAMANYQGQTPGDVAQGLNVAWQNAWGGITEMPDLVEKELADRFSGPKPGDFAYGLGYDPEKAKQDPVTQTAQKIADNADARIEQNALKLQEASAGNEGWAYVGASIPTLFELGAATFSRSPELTKLVIDKMATTAYLKAGVAYDKHIKETGEQPDGMRKTAYQVANALIFKVNFTALSKGLSPKYAKDLTQGLANKLFGGNTAQQVTNATELISKAVEGSPLSKKLLNDVVHGAGIGTAFGVSQDIADRVLMGQDRTFGESVKDIAESAASMAAFSGILSPIGLFAQKSGNIERWEKSKDPIIFTADAKGNPVEIFRDGTGRTVDGKVIEVTPEMHSKAFAVPYSVIEKTKTELKSGIEPTPKEREVTQYNVEMFANGVSDGKGNINIITLADGTKLYLKRIEGENAIVFDENANKLTIPVKDITNTEYRTVNEMVNERMAEWDRLNTKQPEQQQLTGAEPQQTGEIQSPIEQAQQQAPIKQLEDKITPVLFEDGSTLITNLHADGKPYFIKSGVQLDADGNIDLDVLDITKPPIILDETGNISTIPFDQFDITSWEIKPAADLLAEQQAAMQQQAQVEQEVTDIQQGVDPQTQEPLPVEMVIGKSKFMVTEKPDGSDVYDLSQSKSPDKDIQAIKDEVEPEGYSVVPIYEKRTIPAVNKYKQPTVENVIVGATVRKATPMSEVQLPSQKRAEQYGQLGTVTPQQSPSNPPVTPQDTEQLSTTSNTSEQPESGMSEIPTSQDILKRLAAASGDEIIINGTSDGTFAGVGNLNINENGDVVLTRHATDEYGLNKTGQEMTPEELRAVASSGGTYGGASVNTSALEGWGEKEWAAAQVNGENGITGTYTIPVAELEQLLKDGKAAFANLSEGEIILLPEVAQQYLSHINGKPVTNTPVSESTPDMRPQIATTSPENVSLADNANINEQTDNLPVTELKSKTRKSFWQPSKEAKERASVEPTTPEEAVLQWFVMGGQISTDDFTALTGWTAEEQPEEVKGLRWLHKPDGQEVDTLINTISNPMLESFIEQYGSNAIQNVVQDVITSHEDRASMLNRLRQIQDTQNLSPEEQARIQANLEYQNMLEQQEADELELEILGQLITQYGEYPQELFNFDTYENETGNIQAETPSPSEGVTADNRNEQVGSVEEDAGSVEEVTPEWEDVVINKDNYLKYIDLLKSGVNLAPQSLIDIREAIKKHHEEISDIIDKEKDWKKWKSLTDAEFKRFIELSNFIASQPNSYGLYGDINANETYHFTTPENLLLILEENRLSGEGESSGVSTTTNKSFDHPELTQVKYYGENNNPTMFSEMGIRIDLNLPKLKEKYKIKLGSEELGTFIGEEELRIGNWKGIDNVSDYINRIQIDRNVLNNEIYTQILNAASLSGITVVDKTDFSKPINRVLNTPQTPNEVQRNNEVISNTPVEQPKSPTELPQQEEVVATGQPATETPGEVPASVSGETLDDLYTELSRLSELPESPETEQALDEVRMRIYEAKLQKAASETNTNPTEAQKEAGNYKKGVVNFQGMEIAIENPVGSVRKGVDEDGKAWEHVMKSHYGYFKRTQGKDGDQIDTFIGEDLSSPTVYVIDQNNPSTGSFDESKVMLGYSDPEQAKAAYLENYDKDWKGFGSITPVSIEDFKVWLKDGKRQNKPFSEYKDTPAPVLNSPEISDSSTQPEQPKFAGDVLKGIVEPENGLKTLKDRIISKGGTIVSERKTTAGTVVSYIPEGSKSPKEATVFDKDGAISAGSYGTDIENEDNAILKHRRRKDEEIISPTLVALHNINSSDIRNIDKLGGMVTPSIAILQKETPYTDFGSITLVANKELVNPENYDVKIFKGDVYSPSVPRPEWEINKRPYTSWVSRIMIKTYDGYREIASSVQNVIDDFGSFGKALSRYDHEAIKASEYEVMKKVYLIEKGIPIKMPMKGYPVKIGFNTYVNELTPEEKVRAKELLTKFNKETEASSSYLTDETRNAIYQLVYDITYRTTYDIYKNIEALPEGYAVEESTARAEKSKEHTNIHYFTDSLGSYLNNRQQLDTDKIKDAIQKAFKKNVNKAEYDQWLDDLIYSFQGRKYFERGNEKVPYTLENLIDATSGKTRGQEKGLTFGMNRAKSYAMKQMKTVPELHRHKKDLITKEEMSRIEEELKSEYFELADKIRYRYSDTWGKLDDFGKSLADYYKGSSPSGALSRNGFKPTGSDVETFKEFADKLANSPVDYFEAKLQRGVNLSEFKYAIVPEATDKDVIAILKSKGVKVKKYDTDAERTSLVNDLAEKDSQILFHNKHRFAGDALNEILKHSAYHGSPHSFDKFSTEFMGTGEGAQAYGWGLYFTDKKSIAESYAKQLSDVSAKQIKFTVKDYYETPLSLDEFERMGRIDGDVVDRIKESIVDYGARTKDDVIESLRERALKGKTLLYQNYRSILYAKDFVEGLTTLEIPQRNLYQVSLHDNKSPEEYDYLRWDKPVTNAQLIKVSSQLEKEGINIDDDILENEYMSMYDKDGNPESTQLSIYKPQAIANGYTVNLYKERTAESLYQLLSRELKSDKAASQFLLRAGIDGIKYPAQYTSKGTHEDAFNYVVFDENAVKIEEHILFHNQSEIGFYSPTEKALNSIQQTKGTPEQFKAMLLKNGAKQAEMDWMDFDGNFANKKSVTKQDIQDWIDGNKIEVKEVVKGDYSNRNLESVKVEPFVYNVVDTKTNEVVLRGVSQSSADEFIDNAHDGTNTKFSQYVLPGGENYKEVLLTMPENWVRQTVRIEPVTINGKEYWKTINEKTGREDIHGSEYSAYQLKTLQERDGVKESDSFKSSHFDEPNIIAHVRINDRTDTQGRKVLFVEEFQSDWAQKGKKEGFVNPKEELKYNDKNTHVELDEQNKEFVLKTGTENGAGHIVAGSFDFRLEGKTDKEKHEFLINQANGVYSRNLKPLVPNMPFQKTDQWLNLAFRRMMRYATENGYDAIAWTNGEQQAERYDLSKQIDKIHYIKKNNGNYNIDATVKDGTIQTINRDATEKELEEIVGKELSKKIINNEGELRDDNWSTFSGLDLKVGGEGMKAFYDNIVPSAANKLGKPFGAKVEPIEFTTSTYVAGGYTVTIPGGQEYYFPNREEAERYAKKANGFINEKQHTVQSLPITPQMRESVLGGVPLFHNQQQQSTKTKPTHYEVKSHAEKTLAQLNSNTKMVIVDKATELRTLYVNEGASKQLLEQIDGVIANPYYDGFFDPTTRRIVIITSRVNSLEQTESIVNHESVHATNRNFLGVRRREILDFFHEQYGEQNALDYLSEDYSELESFDMADEVIAYTVQEMIDNNTMPTEKPLSYREIVAIVEGTQIIDNFTERLISTIYHETQTYRGTNGGIPVVPESDRSTVGGVRPTEEGQPSVEGLGGNEQVSGTKPRFAGELIGEGSIGLLKSLFDDSKDVLSINGKQIHFYSTNSWAYNEGGLQEYASKMGYKPASIVLPEVTKYDYFISTIGTFELSSQNEYDSVESIEHKSGSGSSYKIKNGVLYRASNHWGKVASCKWYFPYLQTIGSNYFLIKGGKKIWVGNHPPILFGKIKLSDLKRTDNAVVKIFNINSEKNETTSFEGGSLQFESNSQRELLGNEDNIKKHTSDTESKKNLPATISVNGVSRPTTNSLGKPIADTEEKIRNFYEWFGDSKVVDDKGRPMVVYHGTDAVFDEFNIDSSIKNGRGEGNGFYFIADKDVAKKYTKSNNIISAYLKATNFWGGFDSLTQNEKQIYLSTKSDEEAYKKLGIDGISIGGQIIVFSPTQIKSATGNNGDFSPSNPSILKHQFAGDLLKHLNSTQLQGKRIIGKKDYADRFADWIAENVHSVDLWQQEMKKDGLKGIKLFDVYSLLRRRKGIIKGMVDEFDKGAFGDLQKTVARIIDKYKVSSKELQRYLKAKSAIERNDNENWVEVKNKLDSEGHVLLDENDEPITYEVIHKIKAISDDPEDQWSRLPVQDIIYSFENKVQPEDIENLWNKVKASTDFTLNKLYLDGVISKEDYDKWTNRKFYVPLRGWEFDENNSNPEDFYDYVNNEKNGINSQTYVKATIKAKGRTSEPGDPLPYIRQLAHSAVMTSVKNRIARTGLQLFRANQKDPNVSQYLYLKAPFKGNAHEAKRTRQTAEKHEIMGYEGGDRFTLVIGDPHVAQSIKGENIVLRETAKWLGESAYGKLTQFMKANFTGKNPNFFLNNFLFIDVPYAGITEGIKKEGEGLQFVKQMITGKPFKTIHRDITEKLNPLSKAEQLEAGLNSKASIEAAIQQYGEKRVYDTLYKMWKEAGGPTGWMQLESFEKTAKNIEREINRIRAKEANFGAGTQKLSTKDKFTYNYPLRKGAELMEYVMAMSEQSSRFAVFVSRKMAGQNNADAALASKEATVDFDRTGQASTVFNQLFAFFKPTISATYGVYKMAKANKRNFGYAIGSFYALGVLQAILAYLSMPDDDEGKSMYDQIPEYDKLNNIVLPRVWDEESFNKGEYVKIPLPQFFRAIFALGVTSTQAAMGKMGAGEFVGTNMTNLTSAMSPFNISGNDPLRAAIPTAATPGYDILANESFTGRPIYKEMFTKDLEERTPESQKGLKYTFEPLTEATQWWNEVGGGNEFTKAGSGLDPVTGIPKENKTKELVFDLNPAKLQHVFETIGGGRVKFFRQVFATTHALASPDKDLNDWDIPLFYRYLGRTKDSNPKEAYYNAKKAVSEYKYYIAQQKAKDAAEAFRMIGQYGFMNELSFLTKMTDKRMQYLQDEADNATTSEMLKAKTDSINMEAERFKSEMIKIEKKYHITLDK